MNSLISSKERVKAHGEVYTHEREVNLMLDLVKQETLRIESRFLEPACGKGNFLGEVLSRKLGIVRDRYRKNQLDFERYAIVAVSSLYGIDILDDNTEACRLRMSEIFWEFYRGEFGRKSKHKCLDVVNFILSRNIVLGDALTLQTISPSQSPIIFSEWSLVKGSLFKRRDFEFHMLLPKSDDQAPLFDETNYYSDEGKKAFIPKSIADYPLTHFLKILDETSPS